MDWLIDWLNIDGESVQNKHTEYKVVHRFFLAKMALSSVKNC